MAWSKGGALIVTHRNADIDSVAAALTLNYALSSYSSSSRTFEVCLPDGADSVSKRVLQALGFGIPSVRKCASERVVFVDVSSITQVEGVEFSKCSFIDHHAVNTLAGICESYIYDPESKASSALLAEVLMLSGYSIPRSYATLLLAGIMFDTKFLRILNSRLLKVVDWLLNSGADIEDVGRLLTQQEVPYAERVARLRSLSRMGVYSIGSDYLMTITCIGAYESSSLKYPIEAGSDIAIALTPRETETRVTIRASTKLVKDLRAPIAAELAKYVGESLGGGGGGHEAAAGASISKSSINDLERLIIEFFSARGYKVRVLERGRWLEECV
ncbi:MAG: DHH family phosphoesterase [Sulfolobales archaeon]